MKPIARIAALVVCSLLASAAFAQSTAFTYQGKLNSNAQPAEGTHDFRFKLFDAATGGTQIGTTQCTDNLSVTGGVFTATIDFGQQFITTGQRFLEIEVRADTGLNCSNVGGFVVLTPRQPITPTPTATQAKTAFALAAADGSPSNAVVVDNTGNVGIGTAAPFTNLHVAKLGGVPAGGPVILLQDTGGDNTQSGFLDFRNGSGTETAWVGFGTPGDADFSIVNARSNGDIVLSPFQGNVRMSGDLITTGKIFTGVGTVGAIEAKNLTVSAGGVGVRGEVGTGTATNCKGVLGRVNSSDPTSFGVFSEGRLGATGTKSFRIDHPEYPDTHYLYHYSAESPEALNFYRGTVTLDENGRAVVKLPSYFAKINKDPSFQLTALDAPMPSLHIAERISKAALDEGAGQPLGVPGTACSFTIAGGTPGGSVSWRVEAVRNDEFVRKGGAPVEVEKPPHEQGEPDAALSMAEPK